MNKLAILVEGLSLSSLLSVLKLLLLLLICFGWYKILSCSLRSRRCQISRRLSVDGGVSEALCNAIIFVLGDADDDDGLNDDDGEEDERTATSTTVALGLKYMT